MENAIQKEFGRFGMPWEAEYGYAQAVRVKDTIYVSGQLSHDESGKMVAPAPIDPAGGVTDFSNMALQMETTYANARKLLETFGATLDNVVDEVIYVVDMEAAFAVAGHVRKKAYGTDNPACASTIVEVTRLALQPQLVEISFTAVLPDRV